MVMYKKVVPILLVIIWVIVIFTFSSQEGYISQTKSFKIANYIYKYLGNSIKNIDEHEIHYYVRKAAHVFLYLILCMVVMNALYHGGFRGKALFIRAFIICIFYATLDEGYQRFVDGRSGRVKDIFIDSMGIGIGIVGGILLSRIVKMLKNEADNRLRVTGDRER